MWWPCATEAIWKKNIQIGSHANIKGRRTEGKGWTDKAPLGTEWGIQEWVSDIWWKRGKKTQKELNPEQYDAQRNFQISCLGNCTQYTHMHSETAFVKWEAHTVKVETGRKFHWTSPGRPTLEISLRKNQQGQDLSWHNSWKREANCRWCVYYRPQTKGKQGGERRKNPGLVERTSVYQVPPWLKPAPIIRNEPTEKYRKEEIASVFSYCWSSPIYKSRFIDIRMIQTILEVNLTL